MQGSFATFGADGALSLRPLSNVIAPTTTLIFTGLAVALAFRAGHFNIGGETQLLIGGVGIALLVYALTSRVNPGGGAPITLASQIEWLPDPLLLFLLIGVSGLFGALWIFIPAWLQAYRGSHIVITTIMFNYIAFSLVSYLMGLRGFWPRAGRQAIKPARPLIFAFPVCQSIMARDRGLSCWPYWPWQGCIGCCAIRAWGLPSAPRAEPACSHLCWH